MHVNVVTDCCLQITDHAGTVRKVRLCLSDIVNMFYIIQVKVMNKQVLFVLTLANDQT